jgi:hypothetical protein
MHGSLGVRRVNTAIELPIEFTYEPILAQDYISGCELCAFYLCREGRIVASLAYVGSSCGVTFVRDEEIDRNAKILIEHFGYNGVIGFDVVRHRSGEIFFIECNPRFWYRMDLAVIAGLNFVEIGCSGQFEANGPPDTLGAIFVPSRRGLGRMMLAPWRLSRHEISALRFMMRDPLPEFLLAFRKSEGWQS